MEFLIFLIFFLIIASLVLATHIPMYKRHYRATGGVINYDSAMRKFVYKVNLSSEEIVNLLKTKNVVDGLSCTFDFDRSVINFSEHGSDRDYYFHIEDCNDFTILRLEQVALVGARSPVPYKLNPFTVSKLQAELLPYSQYSF